MISTTINRMDCIGTGGAGPFPYTFMIYDKNHLKVYVDGLGPKVVDTDYTVSGVGIGTGNVTFLTGHYPILNSNILIIRDVPLTQLVDYINHSAFDMDILEKSLDYLTMISQQFNELVGRVVKVPVTSLLTELILPEAVVGGELIRWKADKTALDLVNIGLADALNVITTQGDLIIGGAGGIAERLGIGALGKFCKSMGPGANPVWADFSDLNPINLVRNGSFESWLAGTAVAPDNWTLTGAAATVAREAAIFKHGLYSAKVTRVGTDCHLSRNCYIDMGSTYIQSRTFTLGAWVYAAAVDRVRLRINDGVTTSYSSYHTGGSTWEFLTVTVTAGAAVTAFTVGLAVDTGNTSGYIDGAILVEGSTPFPFSSEPLKDHGLTHLPAGTDPIGLPKFSANKNAANQAGVVSGNWTKVTFPTEVYDVGSAYDAANSKWIPGIIGKAHISACILWTAPVDQKSLVIGVYINGVLANSASPVSSGTGDQSSLIGCDIPISVITDYVEIYAIHDCGVDKTILGIVGSTWFMGHMLP